MIKRYSSILILMHWATVALLVTLYITGEDMEHATTRAEKLGYLDLHASIGTSLLVILILRLAIKRWSALPGKPVGASDKEHSWAKRIHASLYATMFLQISLGLLTIFTVGYGVHYFGLFTVPSPFGVNRDLHEIFEDIHKLFWWSIAGIAAFHIAAAWYHLLRRKDGVMARMVPFLKPKA